MMFCDKCESILVPKKVQGKTKLLCGRCGKPSQKRGTIVLKEKTQTAAKKAIEVIDKRLETLPKVKETCPKCGYKDAYYWLVQTRAADEAETRFFKCVKCNHTWRSYS